MKGKKRVRVLSKTEVDEAYDRAESLIERVRLNSDFRTDVGLPQQVHIAINAAAEAAMKDPEFSFVGVPVASDILKRFVKACRSPDLKQEIDYPYVLELLLVDLLENRERFGKSPADLINHTLRYGTADPEVYKQKRQEKKKGARYYPKHVLGSRSYETPENSLGLYQAVHTPLAVSPDVLEKKAQKVALRERVPVTRPAVAASSAAEVAAPEMKSVPLQEAKVPEVVSPPSEAKAALPDKVAAEAPLSARVTASFPSVEMKQPEAQSAPPAKLDPTQEVKAAPPAEGSREAYFESIAREVLKKTAMAEVKAAPREDITPAAPVAKPNLPQEAKAASAAASPEDRMEMAATKLEGLRKALLDRKVPVELRGRQALMPEKFALELAGKLKLNRDVQLGDAADLIRFVTRAAGSVGIGLAGDIRLDVFQTLVAELETNVKDTGIKADSLLLFTIYHGAKAAEVMQECPNFGRTEYRRALETHGYAPKKYLVWFKETVDQFVRESQDPRNEFAVFKNQPGVFKHAVRQAREPRNLLRQIMRGDASYPVRSGVGNNSTSTGTPPVVPQHG